MAEPVKQTKDVELKVGKDLSTATLHGTKVEITPQGNVLLYTDAGVQAKPATGAAPAAGEDNQITIGKDFNAVAMYGAKVELATDGSLIVYTNGTVTVKPADANDTAIQTAKYALEAGDRIPDGSIYAGVSPDTGKQMFAMPTDACVAMSFNEAAKYAKKLNTENTLGHDDWRVPTKAELNVLFQNKEKGALKATFNVTGSFTAGWYWSSAPGYLYSAWG